MFLSMAQQFADQGTLLGTTKSSLDDAGGAVSFSNLQYAGALGTVTVAASTQFTLYGGATAELQATAPLNVTGCAAGQRLDNNSDACVVGSVLLLRV